MLFILSTLVPQALYCGSCTINKVESDIMQLGQAIELYESILGKNIKTLKDISQLTQSTPAILYALPDDPWDQRYGYKYLGGRSATFIIWSSGSIDSDSGLIMYAFEKHDGRYTANLMEPTKGQLF
ncbi:type II secretion system protein GspG [Pseudoalteromonas obscura]|uniref:Type II secretion system protein GspG n=1 Tax=Pseudoalteromonas obscura TaxID=3048491 RepID=A0ABT7EF77_9GAMM|nr:type II secretion system protein GspG [Pseudoalteromonas sp. P94(2023)]MDK2593924.1 type II secretion system protein GspG [Pseudoalteromonas sp. P94(2023)]